MDRDRLIVLKKTAYGESDLILRGLNTQGAKVSFLAPAALRSRRRFGGGVLEPTHFIEVVYQKASSNKATWPRLQEAHIIKEFSGLRENYERLQTALTLVSLIDHIGQEGDSQGEDLFNLLGHGLQTLSSLKESSLIFFRLHFLLKFLFQQGVLNRENWMTPFLQTPLKEHNHLLELLSSSLSLSSDNLDESFSLETLFLDHLLNVERVVQSYRETGASH